VGSCLPCFDGDPVFFSLLQGNTHEPEHSFVTIVVQDFPRSEQHYQHKRVILIIALYDADGPAIEIADFAPRFKRLDRIFRSMMMVGHVRLVIDHPRIRLWLRPTYNYGTEWPQVPRGSNHIGYVVPQLTRSCTTGTPITCRVDEDFFVLEEPLAMMVGVDDSLPSPIDDTSREFCRRTLDCWLDWARYLVVPFE
jgi:hypothetical protein